MAAVEKDVGRKMRKNAGRGRRGKNARRLAGPRRNRRGYEGGGRGKTAPLHPRSRSRLRPTSYDGQARLRRGRRTVDGRPDRAVTVAATFPDWRPLACMSGKTVSSFSLVS